MVASMVTKFINIYGGPGSGKSTTAARLFGEMKVAGYDVELVTEVAKDLVWEGRTDTLSIQPYVTLKQYRNIMRLKDKVEYVITDSPIRLGLIYADFRRDRIPNSYWDFIRDIDKMTLRPCYNILLERSTKFNTNGRVHSESKSKEIDKLIEKELSDLEVYVMRPQDVSISSLQEMGIGI